MSEVIQLEHLRQWVGRTDVRDDSLSPWTAQALEATLRSHAPRLQPDDALPPLWHWAYFLPTAPQDQLGPDGHPVRGGFLPPVPLPRRMWAGSQLEFLAPLRIGQWHRKTSTVVNVTLKQGRGGELVFVQVEHTVHDARSTVILRDRHDIVYREAPLPGGPPQAPQSPPGDAAWAEDHRPDAPLLFRYSALTFNSHRIHYDHPYATQVEGYADLVVHGPLIATLMLEGALRQYPQRSVVAYRFKAVRPLTCNRRLRVCGQALGADGSAVLWAEDEEGALLMHATVQFR